MRILAGIDIGGTKCAVSVGEEAGATIRVIGQCSFPTPASPRDAIDQVRRELDQLSVEHGLGALDADGISCGGPLDSTAGIVLSPPNLPAWDHIDVVTPLRDHFGVPVGLQNDAKGLSENKVFISGGMGEDDVVPLAVELIPLEVD